MSFVTEHLRVWGPDANYRVPSLQEAQAYCQELATSHYENFAVASWLLPRRLRQHFYNVYSYCRWSDDLGDEVGDCSQSLLMLNWWEQELNACFAGESRHPVFVALKETLIQFDIPKAPFVNLLSAFRQDQTKLTYDSFDELQDYCRLSANPVGHLVLYLGDRANSKTVSLSDSICTGLQLANFWQDVARDAAIGRRYLPLDDMTKWGYSNSDWLAGRTNAEFLGLMQFQVQRAREFLLQGLPLISLMPPDLRIDIELFARGGLRILEKIEELDYRVWDTRPKVTKWDAVRLFWKCWWKSWGTHGPQGPS